MTAIKRCCALALAVLMILTALPVTAFAQAAEQEVNASLQETTVSGIANDIARQVLRSGQKNGEKIQMENTAKLDDSDEVEIIVVVNDSVADPDSRAQVNALLRTQKSALAQINRAIDGQVEPQRQYTTLLNGFSATVTYGQYKAIRKLDCVQSAFISPTFELLPDTANSNRMIGGGIYNTTGFTGEGMLVAILDTGVDMGHEIFKTAPKSPSLTREKLQSMLETYDFQVESIVKGISVSDLYYSAKIPFQFDYGDRDKDGMPGDKGSHGTHVASTAAGNTGVNEAAMGVAPQAQIINMNVFKSTGGASYADILAALEDCILLGVDVANLSLGSDCGYIDYDSEDAFTKSLLDVFERTGESGVSLAVAAGNAYNAAYGDAFGGKALASNPDYGLVSEPSTYGESLSVAAVSNGMVKGPYVTVGGKDLAYQDSATISEDENAKPFRSLSARGSIEYVVVPNYGAEEDYAGLDLTGKIALVQRGGGMYYEQKERNAANAGAIGMLVYNNVPGMLYMSITDWKIPCAFISQAAGEYMKQQETKTLSVASADALVESPTYGMADFSSWGATPELTLKPEITAPGAGIYAAVPGGYESMDGTSMASPHAAGGMAIVQQALKARDNSMTGAQRKHMTDTLLMSTAHVIYDDNGVPYSPRKQGAGLMSINDAVNTRGYLSVEGMERPKLELKDDPAMKGVYTMNFTVHNTGSDTLYYDVTPLVLTDTTEAYVNGSGQEFSTISGSSRLLPHTFTSNCENNRVAVAPGKTADVTVTVTVTGEGRKMLAQFPNGSYVEGFVTLTQVAADGSALTDPIDLGLPFLAFYGDWTKAPIMDSTDYWETLDGSASQAQAYMNTAFSSSSENTVDTYLGDNNYTTVPYLADRNAISPNNDDFMDSLTGIYTGLLRNTKSLRYTITGANGQVYYSKDCEYVGKSIYSYDYYRIVPAGVDAEYDGIEPWYGTDSHNAKLPNNTKATVTIEATLPYGDGVGTNQKHSWSFPITIDTEEPHADNLKVTESEGRYYLSLDVSDNQYVAAVVFYNIKNSEMLYGMQGFGEDKPGVTSHIKEYDITGFGETFGMIVHDYAGNSKVYTVRAPGNPDDHGTITPTNILWTENFNEKWLPDDWSVQSKGGSLNTWYRDEDYMAAVDHDDDNQQDEWLISRTTDISGVDTEVHMVFDFYTTYWYTVEYKHCNLQVMASGDGGENWQEIWNLQRDSGLFTAWTKTQAKVTIPESLQSSKDLRFAFVYTGKGGSTLSMDNVQLYAEERDNYVSVTATAGEGGSITPAGAVSVKEGASQTFAIAAQEGYAIADVLVDGQSVGAVDSYTFENVTANHTIAALFTKTASDVQFDNDFESETFPGHGWTLQSTRSDSPYTWYQGTNRNLNTTKQARIDMDYYEDPWGGGWSVGSIRKPLLPMAGGSDKLQDEYLISPVVNLTGKTPTLSFDYLLFKSVIGNYCSVTVEATTDGGQTWTTIWNAADLEPVSGYWFMGTANVAVPAAFCTDNAQFAFHFYKKANRGYDDTDAMFAIDNVTMTYGATDPCADGHTLTAVAEVPATCEETGVKAHWVCSVCGKLFSDAEGKNETTLEALTIGVLGHDYGEAAWTWTGYESAKATFTCSRDASHVEEVTAAVTSEITTPASCESTGVRTYTATVTFQGKNYTDTRTETLPSLGHAWGEPVWTWTGCGAAEASFACARDAGHVKVLPASITSEVTTQPGCSTEGVRTYTATVTLEGKNYTDTRTETLPSLGHKTQLVGAKPATCTEDGYTGDEVCTVCQEVVKKGEVIPALGHKTQLVGAKAATCTEDGYTGDEVCTVCGETVKKGEVIPAPGHKTQLVGAKAATCTEDGYTGDEVCTVCGETVKKGEVIPAPGHKTQLVGAKAATCTEDGYTGDEVCTVCQEVVKKGEVIPATGHDYKDGKCTNCGETDPNYKPAEPENPGVKTGDEAHTALWLAAASVSLLAAAALLLSKKKHLS